MSRLTPEQWKEEFEKQARALVTDSSLIFINETKIQDLMEQYGDDLEGVLAAAALECDDINEVIDQTMDDSEPLTSYVDQDHGED